MNGVVVAKPVDVCRHCGRPIEQAGTGWVHARRFGVRLILCPGLGRTVAEPAEREPAEQE